MSNAQDVLEKENAALREELAKAMDFLHATLSGCKYIRKTHLRDIKITKAATRAATVEECAKVCDDALGDYAKADELADAIRALLKEKNGG